MAAEAAGNIRVFRFSDIQLDDTPIGRGGYGTVYRGCHPELGTVAVKTLIDNGQLPQKHIRILQREAKKLLQVCQHEGVLKLHGLIMEKDNYSMILEYMALGNASDFRREFSVQYPLMVRMTKEIISAMDFLHSQEPHVLHLDLKADNVLLTGLLHAKIADFGLTEWKTVTMTATRRTDATNSSRRCTVSHVPPEVWSNINTPPDKAYDIYSFGICLWEMLTGKIPYGNATDDLIRSAVLSGQRPDFILIPQACPGILKQLIMRCWHQKPPQRPSFSVLKVEVDKAFQDDFQKDILTSLRNIRQEVLENYPADDPVYIATNDIDMMAESETEVQSSSSEQQQQQQEGQPQSSTTQEDPMETAEEQKPRVEPVMYKDESELTICEQQLRKVLRDPIALRLARTPYAGDIFTLNDEYKAILNDDEKLKRYLDEDILFKREILYPGNDFWGNIGGSHINMSKHRGRTWEYDNKRELSDMSRKGRYGHSSSFHGSVENKRTKRRKRVESCMFSHPHIEELKKGGNYHRVKKALQNPEQFEQLLEEHDKKGDSSELSLRLTTLDPEVIELAKDPVTLIAILHSDFSLLNNLCSKHPKLLLKVFGRAQTRELLPGSGNDDRGRRLNMSSFEREMMEEVMGGMMGRRMGGMREMEMMSKLRLVEEMRRHHSNHSDSDSDDDMLGGMGRRSRGMRNMMRPNSSSERLMGHILGMDEPSMMERDRDIFMHPSKRMGLLSKMEERERPKKGLMHKLKSGFFGADDEAKRRARIDAQNKEFMRKYEAEKAEKKAKEEAEKAAKAKLETAKPSTVQSPTSSATAASSSGKSATVTGPAQSSSGATTSATEATSSKPAVTTTASEKASTSSVASVVKPLVAATSSSTSKQTTVKPVEKVKMEEDEEETSLKKVARAQQSSQGSIEVDAHPSTETRPSISANNPFSALLNSPLASERRNNPESRMNTDVSASALSASGVSVQNVSAPHVSAQEVSTPDVSLPDVSAPDVSAPDVSAPDVSAPDVSAPVVSAPVVSAPGLHAPDLNASGTSVSELRSRNVSLPGVTVPDVSVPLVKASDLSSPAGCVPDGSAQAISASDEIAPDITATLDLCGSRSYTEPSVSQKRLHQSSFGQSVPMETKKAKLLDLETDTVPTKTRYEQRTSEKTSVKDRDVIEHQHADGAKTTISMKPGQPRANIQVGEKNIMLIGAEGQGDGEDPQPQRPKKSKRNKKIEAPGRAVTDRDCDIVAENLGKDYRRLFWQLGLGESQIDRMNMDYKDEGKYEVNYQLMRKWRTLGQASLSRLFQALQDVERYDIIALIPK